MKFIQNHCRNTDKGLWILSVKTCEWKAKS
jgi:hypothetical protein